ncbi:MAG: hypothetical protein WAW61_00215 [Methylococcaceae bacterium]
MILILHPSVTEFATPLLTFCRLLEELNVSDGVANPVRREGCNPRPAWETSNNANSDKNLIYAVKATFYDSGLNAADIDFDDLLTLALKVDNTIPIYMLFFAYLF